MACMDPNLKTTAERLLRCKVRFVGSVFVVLPYGYRVAWSGSVSVFDLIGHPKAARTYAWSTPIVGSKKLRYHAVLHISPVDSPEQAVRASIERDRKMRGPQW